MDPLLAIVQALRDADVDFVVVGGVAVVLRGHPRMTVDLDLVARLEQRNLLRALSALEDQGLVPRLPVPAASFADDATRASWVADRNMTVFSLHDPSDPRREVDIFAEEPITWAELSEQADDIVVRATSVPVASVEHLITMKRAAARPQDLADIAALEAAVGARDTEATDG
ncbi:nucleotidyl transferase AbiEii/AbiGii toxin family protein [Euzebya tangerina]|uniref:nucleotidyl transferase AbiEii/AbiGii toxin family protein n=1 Tax=Euzebya tangerina TaxID=591198 RepID=UPI000E31E986|nr:nucleotidyl transferase AbiEii/AbiGii toxin family protein [Euzebya tangerina]